MKDTYRDCPRPNHKEATFPLNNEGIPQEPSNQTPPSDKLESTDSPHTLGNSRAITAVECLVMELMKKPDHT
ncbi:hypothetical protein Bca52824_019180 [Brassica carinata]|uniref:Uncharacterized protein n=1 Tax=Brassica carinata TaxID=52824 RepID=A0A8X8AZE9_BRACI|nr:hypothetical protein Bca52824_019180 [Brassica carinata]